ncbi:MAG TPA: DUF4142 domain-containing protein [Gemmatimonadaceae bacterium]|nr:DUF4142 domain-containing protein [Gemmatimonadaceae bacterium]
MRSAAAAALCLSIAACSSGVSSGAESREDTTGRRDSIAAVAVASMNESNVIGLLSQVHEADSALGALAAAKGSTLNVKEFGRMVLREHRALRKDIIDLGEQMGAPPVPPSTPADAPPAAGLNALNDASASLAWDAAYLDYTIAEHQSSLENTARALAATRRVEVRQFVSRSVPILQKHLDKARQLRKALSRARPAPVAQRPSGR